MYLDPQKVSKDGQKAFRKMMIADHTGSANVTFWKDNISKGDGLLAGHVRQDT